MSSTTRHRAPRPTQAALREQAATAKAEATQAAQTAKVEAAEVETSKPREAATGEVQNYHVNAYRNAVHTAASSKHTANVHAVAYFRTLPETVLVTVGKSQKNKPVGAIERARQTIEALCVRVERGADGKVKRGDDVIGFTPQRLTQVVEAFLNAERSGVVKVADMASTEVREGVDAEQEEALVSAFDQARVVGGTKAAEALASSVRERAEEVAEAEGVSPLVAAVETVQSDVVALREAKKSQEVSAPVVKTPAQVVGDAVQVLWDALSEHSSALDAGQRSAILGKINELVKFVN